MKINLKILILVLLLNASNLLASEDSLGNSKYGIFGSYNIHHFLASFKKLPEVPSCCPNYGNGDGRGFNLSLLYEIPLPLSLHLGLRAGLATYNGSFYSLESTVVKVDSILMEGKFQHNLSVRLTDFSIEPYLLYEPFRNFNILLGGHIGYYISNKYDQKEVLLEPETRGVFVDTKTRTRNILSGDIPNVDGINGGLVLGINYNLPLNRQGSLMLTPEFAFFQGLTDVIKNLNWTINSFRFGAALKYTKIDVIPPKIPKVNKKKSFNNIDTLIVESENILKKSFKVGASQIFTENQTINDTNFTFETIRRTDTIYKRPIPIVNLEINTDKINIQSQFVTEGYPVLPVVFFGYMSSEVSDFYNRIQDTNKFDSENLEMNPIVFHKNVMNIIAKRLKSNPAQTIVLQGFADSSMEKGDCDLALRRAEAVKKYLVEVWKIDGKRIRTKTKNRFCTPPQNTYTQNDSGYAENRRVEISTDNKEVLTSVLRKKFLQLTGINPTIIEFNPTGTTQNGVNEWFLNVSQNNKQILFRKGSGNPKVVTDTIFPDMARELSGASSLDIEYGIVDSEGKPATIRKQIQINKDTLEYEVQRLSLILFSVNSDKIPDAAKNDLTTFLSGVDQNDKIKISGYSDILGNQEENRNLSTRRAQNTANLIRNIAPEIEISTVDGYGAFKFPPGINTYSSAVERFLSRTVQVEIVRKRVK